MSLVFDITTLLWLLPLVFALGWIASRVDIRQWRRSEQQAPKAYFRGLNFLLNEQQDQAIDSFIEAVQHDPETSELHFALGNLFRRRGEYDRAVRVHEHLLARSDLSSADRQRAQHGLAMDFLKAGLLDRAEGAFRKLENTPFATEAQLALLAIFERSRDWEKAIEIAKRLESGEQGSFRVRRAHYHCELADVALQAGQTDTAMAALEQAIQLAPESPRAYLAISVLQAAQNETSAALETLFKLTRRAPSATPLVAQRLVGLATTSDARDRVRQQLQSFDQLGPSLDVTLALSTLDAAEATSLLVHHLDRTPSLATVAQLVKQDPAEVPTLNHPLVSQAINRAAAPLTRYRCAACGFEAKAYFWQCPGCQSWDSFPARRVEEL
jgi:lipopolysaccharide biosynthesis regulator YciM